MKIFSMLFLSVLSFGLVVADAQALSHNPPSSVIKKGSTLTIKAENGRQLVLRDFGSSADGSQEEYRHYDFYLYFEETGHVLIYESQNEWAENLMVSLKTGTSFYIHGNGKMNPALSPDHRRFAIYSSNEEEQSDELPRNSVRIWKFINDVGVLEGNIFVPEEPGLSGFLMWADNSTIQLLKDGKPWMAIKRNGKEWKLLK